MFPRRPFGGQQDIDPLTGHVVQLQSDSTRRRQVKGEGDLTVGGIRERRSQTESAGCDAVLLPNHRRSSQFFDPARQQCRRLGVDEGTCQWRHAPGARVEDPVVEDGALRYAGRQQPRLGYAEVTQVRRP